MRGSIWSSYFMDLSPEEMVKAFANKGWCHSELSDEHARVLLQRGNPEIIGRKFKRFSQAHGLSFPQGHLWLNCDIATVNQTQMLEDMKKWLDLFHAVGIRNAVLHPGGDEMMRIGYSYNQIMDVRVKAIGKLCDYLKGTKINICLENMISTISECEELLEIIKLVSSKNLAICLDTGHLNLCSGRFTDFIKKSGKHLKALHVADNEGTFDQHVMPFGRGSVPWDEVIFALKESNYSGLFNLEIPGERECPLPVRLAKLDYLRSVILYFNEKFTN